MKVYSCWQLNAVISYLGQNAGNIHICPMYSGKVFDIWIDMLEEANKTNQPIIIQETFGKDKELCMVFNPADDLLDVVRYFHLGRGWKGRVLRQLLRQVKKHMEERSKGGAK